MKNVKYYLSILALVGGLTTGSLFAATKDDNIVKEDGTPYNDKCEQIMDDKTKTPLQKQQEYNKCIGDSDKSTGRKQ